jgi:hypothetical protein
MAEDVAEATESLPKEAGLVGLERPLDQTGIEPLITLRLGQSGWDACLNKKKTGD